MISSLRPLRAKPSRAQILGLSYFLPAILAVTAVVIGVVKADIDKREQFHVSQQVKAAEQLARVASNLETNIHGNVNLIYGLVAAIAVDPNMNQAQFTSLVERIFGVPSQLRNVAAAKDLVINLVYPEEPNRKSLGLDYTKNELQKEAVMQAVQRRALVITGPVDLVQGGRGLIARYPVFGRGSGQFWGVVSAVIDLDRLYRDSNVNTARQDLDIAIARRPIPTAKDLFLGKLDIFHQDPVRTRIELGYDTWYLAAVPQKGWQALPPDIMLFRAMALMIAICIVAPLIWAGALMKQRHRNIHMLQEREEQLEAQNAELRATRLTLEHQSLHDALTGLANRRFLDQFMTAATATPSTDRLAFIHIDLDRFKEVNDTLGHAAGDAVLKDCTARLLKHIGPEEFACRIGGDEFVVVVSGADPLPRSKVVAKSIVQALAKPMQIDGQEIRIGCSAGIACQATPADDVGELLINADIALYEAKKRGRGRVECFTEELRAAAVHTKRLSDELLTALEHDQIIPYFQPQFDARTMAIAGVEVLARWNHPTRGILPPDRFLPVAESLHRSAEIDAIILDKALFEATRWRTHGIDVPHLSVNISAQRLADERLFKRLSEISFESGSLAVELLESISFEGQGEELKSAIHRLKALGIDIEIDDFGTGHASIVSLLELGPKRLKIDRKLIAPLEAEGAQLKLVASIIEIGRSLGIEIVAEGVETDTHVEILRSLGCQTLQGYAFAKPMSASDFITFAQEWQAENSKPHLVRIA
ncbi:EAL domain-containing protein [Rhizobium sp. NTR19]|uniref:EAL domain-containing protein n=1 Tax=Neorhizobium turbinariae TaxID=2937795 RepID=A0ABT0IKM6_9HYPH|nr:EAL domain-containing protein [Neorhizobium turbinariae]MCK8778420.1 EAL domain-containing protein [Neorhizobium turbinariae]